MQAAREGVITLHLTLTLQPHRTCAYMPVVHETRASYNEYVKNEHTHCYCIAAGLMTHVTSFYRQGEMPSSPTRTHKNRFKTSRAKYPSMNPDGLSAVRRHLQHQPDPRPQRAPERRLGQLVRQQAQEPGLGRRHGERRGGLSGWRVRGGVSGEAARGAAVLPEAV